MKNAGSVLSIKFNSTHSYEKLMNICQEDLEILRNVPGLIQKYYFLEETTRAICGFYIFKSKKAKEAFWNSDLAKCIPARYGIEFVTLRVENFDTAIVMNDVFKEDLHYAGEWERTGHRDDLFPYRKA